ncbi:19661_t:CDS:2 [Gigaspora rosea]|nr:19661_t:CDS:2 [Gigaspora rosea]
MRLHLARQCLNVPDEIKYFWRDFITEEKTPTQKKAKHNQSEITIHFPKIEPLPEARSCTQFLVEMRSWKRKDEPYNLSYNSIRKTPIKWWQLQLYGKNLSNEELYESINTSMVTNDLLETLDDNTNNGETNKSKYLEDLTLNIANSVDLTLTEFLASGDAIFSSEPVTTNRARDVDNMNYDPIELARRQMVLQDEED